MNRADSITGSPPSRLVELVVHLTDCNPRDAEHVIDLTDDAIASHDEKLDAVARAIVRLRRRHPIDLDEPLDLRDDIALQQLDGAQRD